MLGIARAGPMTPSRSSASRDAPGWQTDSAVVAFLHEPPLKQELEVVLGGIEWNATRFHHTGGMVNGDATKGMKIADPGGRLERREKAEPFKFLAPPVK